MVKDSEKFLEEQQTELTKHIFKGLTIAQISKKMNCAISTVSYQINLLYSKYSAKTRSEFILSVFSRIVDNYKQLVVEKNERINFLEGDMEEMRNILLLLIKNKNNPCVFDYWAQESKKFFI